MLTQIKGYTERGAEINSLNVYNEATISLRRVFGRRPDLTIGPKFPNRYIPVLQTKKAKRD
jgi:hypothetical protein